MSSMKWRTLTYKQECLSAADNKTINSPSYGWHVDATDPKTHQGRMRPLTFLYTARAIYRIGIAGAIIWLLAIPIHELDEAAALATLGLGLYLGLTFWRVPSTFWPRRPNLRAIAIAVALIVGVVMVEMGAFGGLAAFGAAEIFGFHAISPNLIARLIALLLVGSVIFSLAALSAATPRYWILLCIQTALDLGALAFYVAIASPVSLQAGMVFFFGALATLGMVLNRSVASPAVTR